MFNQFKVKIETAFYFWEIKRFFKTTNLIKKFLCQSLCSPLQLKINSVHIQWIRSHQQTVFHWNASTVVVSLDYQNEFGKKCLPQSKSNKGRSRKFRPSLFSPTTSKQASEQAWNLGLKSCHSKNNASKRCICPQRV